MNKENTQIENLNNEFDKQSAPITNSINSLQEEFNIKTAAQTATDSTQKDTLEKNRSNIENKINQYRFTVLSFTNINIEGLVWCNTNK